jgi:hypothetical protein
MTFVELREITSVFDRDERFTINLTQDQYRRLKERQQALRKLTDDYLNKLAREPDGRVRRGLQRSLAAHMKTLNVVTEIIIRSSG